MPEALPLLFTPPVDDGAATGPATAPVASPLGEVPEPPPLLLAPPPGPTPAAELPDGAVGITRGNTSRSGEAEAMSLGPRDLSPHPRPSGTYDLGAPPPRSVGRDAAGMPVVELSLPAAVTPGPPVITEEGPSPLPVVRSRPGPNGNGNGTSDGPVLPLVREHVLRHGPLAQRRDPFAPSLREPVAQRRSPMPLAGVGAAAPSRPAPQPTAPSGPRGSVPAATAASSGPPSAAAPSPPAAAPPVDIEHIVDTVHRRFLRRLAVEGERRGVR